MTQPLAYVHPQAKVANTVVIEPFVNIEKNVTIGEGTWIGSHVTIMEGARIGKNCQIFLGAVIAAIPQDLETICLKCLEKSPPRRYQTAGELAELVEVTLRGRVLPVGGVRDKALAALRNGITTIIIPESNVPLPEATVSV